MHPCNYTGETLSEGGFAPNRVSAASLLDAGVTKDKKGKTYYNLEILSRTGRFELHTGRAARIWLPRLYWP
jgi:hypothetical protein